MLKSISLSSFLLIFISLQAPASTHPELWNIAKASLEQNIVNLPSGSYLRADPRHFGSLWTRDFCFAIKGLIASGHSDVVKSHLGRLLEERSPIFEPNLIPRVLDSISSSQRVLAYTSLPFLPKPPLKDPLKAEYVGEHKTVAMDSNALVVLGAIEYYKQTQDELWWNINRHKIVEVYQFYYQQMKNGLVKQSKYADWQDSVTREGHSLYVNFLVWKASKELAKLEPSAVDESMLDSFRDRIKTTFYHESTGLYKTMANFDAISLDAMLLILDDEDFISNPDARHGLYLQLKKHPLWNNHEVPGHATYPNYPESWRSLTTRMVGLGHYHDELYWSWLMALSGKIAFKYEDRPMAKKIFDRLEMIARRDGGISEIYLPSASFERFESNLYRSSMPFSWGSGLVLEALAAVNKSLPGDSVLTDEEKTEQTVIEVKPEAKPEIKQETIKPSEETEARPEASINELFELLLVELQRQ